MLFIEYPKCSTCKKAKKFLEDNNQDFIDRNIITETPSKEELETWIKKYDIKLDKLYNTSGMKYKELNPNCNIPISIAQKIAVIYLPSDIK